MMPETTLQDSDDMFDKSSKDDQVEIPLTEEEERSPEMSHYSEIDSSPEAGGQCEVDERPPVPKYIRDNMLNKYYSMQVCICMLCAGQIVLIPPYHHRAARGQRKNVCNKKGQGTKNELKKGQGTGK